MLRSLGHGGMGVVYEAYDRERDMRVALKALRRLDTSRLVRLKREFRALAKLCHPNIVGLYELVCEGEEWFFTMELVEGEDVVSFVRHVGGGGAGARVGGPDAKTYDEGITAAQGGAAGGDTELDLGEVSADITGGWHDDVALDEPRRHIDEVLDQQRLRESLVQLVQALEELHEVEMVHCDLKPSNVMVTREGRLVLMDFGVVSQREPGGDYLGESHSQGTPAFMAPEQARGEQPTPAADWYAFGVILYQILTGRLPFEGGLAHMLVGKQEVDPLPPRMFTDGIPDDIEDLCMALMSRDPTERPSSAAILEVLRQVRYEPGVGLVREAVQSVDGRAEIFVGRASEIEALQRCLDEARVQGTRCAIVEGPTGIGKSSVVRQFFGQLYEVTVPGESLLILSGRCHERESVAYKAFDSIIDQLGLFLLGLPELECRALLPTDVALLARLFPVFQRLPGGSAEVVAHDGSIELRPRAGRALGALLARLARQRPLILCIEDLQWADQASFELLLGLLEAPAAARMLILATLRRDDPPGASSPNLAALTAALVQHPLVRRVGLGPLSPAEQGELVERLGRERVLRQPIDDALWRECGGHPMLLAELVRYAEQADTALTAGEGLHLDDVIRLRVERLPAVARSLLEAIAVAGEPVPLRILAQAAGLAPAERERARAVLGVTQLARLARVERELWLDAYHDKVREAVVEDLQPPRLTALHGGLARAMDDWREAPRALLARHWMAAGKRAEAVRYLMEAARASSDTLAFERAGELYRTVLDLLPEDESEHEHGTDPRVDRQRAQACLELARGLRVVDRNQEALALLVRAERAAERHHLVHLLADIEHMRGNLLYPTDDLDGCRDAHERALAYAREADSPRREAAALSGVGDAYYMRGRLLGAYERYDRCIALCQHHGFSDIEAANLSMRGIMNWFQNELEAAVRDATRAAEMAAKLGQRRAEINARSSCLGVVLVEMGRFERSYEELVRARDLARDLGARRFEAQALLFLGRLRQLQGRRAEAELLVGDGIEIFRQAGIEYVGPVAFGLLALVTERPALRERAVSEAECLLRAGSASHNFLYFYRYAMDMALSQGDLERAERYADALEDYMRPEPVPWSRFFIQRTRALVACARQHHDARTVALLRGLYHEADRVGLHVAATALHEAFASIA
ncbi:serine/threonine-protein kinase PknK [Haliangium sp.]|uniref:serine/threonine-protein kinase n=1 Tax=Haliangium sp. TaxID=2663208 RepID=UPI003D0C4442